MAADRNILCPPGTPPREGVVLLLASPPRGVDMGVGVLEVVGLWVGREAGLELRLLVYCNASIACVEMRGWVGVDGLKGSVEKGCGDGRMS